MHFIGFKLLVFCKTKYLFCKRFQTNRKLPVQVAGCVQEHLIEEQNWKGLMGHFKMFVSRFKIDTPWFPA